MHTQTLQQRSLVALAIVAAIAAKPVLAEASAPSPAPDEIEEVLVVGRSVSYANNATEESMLKQQTSMTSVLATIDNLPGVLINEGDTFGSDDWSTSISIRGFSVDLDQQQIGMTVDGIANGNSNYGGGAKANRFIDTENLRAVEVSQGTADIASRSHEALGGTINFTTINPGNEQQLIVSSTLGEFDAQKLFMRYETGEIADNTFAWVSFSTQENTDWMNHAAENTRDHMAAKIVSYIGNIDITGYLSYDDTHEDNYQRIYSNEQFARSPQWDELTSDWSGTPYIDQSYRRGWSTLRENWFGYLEAGMDIGAVNVTANAYFHHNEGRGDWVPPYIVDVADDGANGHSELTHGNTYFGGAPVGQIYFVDANGNSLAPVAGCESSLTFPYGGGAAVYDPACYASSAIPVGSYRHTNYQKDRVGINIDGLWTTMIGDMENTLRGGLWYEDYERKENRSWQKIIDSRAGYEFDNVPYWVQYSNEFPVETLMFYIENEINLGFATARLGAKKFNVDIEKKDMFVPANSLSVSSDSDVLMSAGVVAPLPVDGVEVFTGFSQNYAAIKDGVLESSSVDISTVEPETADNIDLGVRYVNADLSASMTYYAIDFDNRITYQSAEDLDGVDYLGELDGTYVNVGGVESEGIELALDYRLSNTLGLYMSYTHNNSEYKEPPASTGFIDGQRVVGSAKDMFVVSLDYVADVYNMGLSTKYVGERSAGAFDVDAYTVSDVYLGATVESPVPGISRIDVRLTVNNLLDESYLGTVVNGGAWIGAPRTAALNLNAAF